jgi:hypothetical protein
VGTGVGHPRERRSAKESASGFTWERVVELRDDLERHYGAAVGRVELLREKWEEEGRPILGKGSRGQPVPHALVRALQDAERHADALRRSLLPSRMGRRPTAVPSAFPAGPSARLRAVGEPNDRMTRKT